MRVLVIYDPQNTFVESLRRFKLDGNEFKSQAMKCKEYYKSNGHIVSTIEICSGNAFKKRTNLFNILKIYFDIIGKHDRIIFFCHGAKYNLNRKMISMANIRKFAEKLKSIASDQCKIVLFSCWTGAAEDGFADKLSELTGFDVIAHTTRGHTTRNPNKIVFGLFETVAYVMNSTGRGGEYKKTRIPDNKKLWPGFGGIKALKKRLNQSPDAPFEFVEEVFNGK